MPSSRCSYKRFISGVRCEYTAIIESRDAVNSSEEVFATKEELKKLYLVEFVLSVRQKIQEDNKNSRLDYPTDYHVYDKTYSKDYNWNIKVAEANGFRKVFLLSTNDIPDLNINIEITCISNSSRIDFKTKINNGFTNKRIRLHFPTNLQTNYSNPQTMKFYPA